MEEKSIIAIVSPRKTTYYIVLRFFEVKNMHMYFIMSIELKTAFDNLSV